MFVGLFFLALFLTYVIKEFTLKKNILDIPNERSSHTVATPRGGGLAIIITLFVGLFIYKESINDELFFALFCVTPIVIVSLIDDIVTLSSKVRFAVQALSSFLALYCLGGVDSVDFIWFEFSGVWLNVVAFILILWLTNLYNFLDGIDGYAGSQTVTVGLGVFLLFNNFIGLLLIVASLGFLVFNWHKASIFMGDVGSASLGFIIAILAVSDMGSGHIYSWLVLLSLFWYDATVTLFRRYLNNETITEAHRKHAYQRLTQMGWSHAKVVIYAIIFNLIFLGLLMLFHPVSVFILNILSLYLIAYYIEKKKSFYNV